jgi:hypothetical protein
LKLENPRLGLDSCCFESPMFINCNPLGYMVVNIIHRDGKFLANPIALIVKKEA